MKRVTFMLDEDNEKVLRQRQAKRIKDTEESYSFSAAINDLLREKK